MRFSVGTEEERMTESENSDGRILVVDDEESLRLTFKMFLTKEGFGPVSIASTYEEALGQIEKVHFELIVSDIVMEGASGIDLLRRVKEMGLECAVVMVTGYPNIKSAAEAVRLGAFDYLPKPVKKEDLLRTARLALQQQKILRESRQFEAEKERYRIYLETIFRSVRELIFTVDHDLRIIQLNDRAVEWADKSFPELRVGNSLQDIPGILGETCCNDAKAVMEKHEEVAEHRIEFQAAGGLTVFRLSASPLESGAGKFLGVIIVARDVSHLESLEKRGKREQFHRLVGASRPMQTVYALIENVGQVDTSVLITGESGTGKELVAEALHAESPRHEMPLVKVDCTAMPENLLESELFGHRKGSFTGADRDRKGRILQADGGTLFLDEIGDISPTMQLRLLRFLQERTFYPVGQDTPLSVDVRVIAATNADLRQKVAEGKFREDLYFRLRVIDIMLPPLRERIEDLALLVKYFLMRFNKRLSKEITGISDQALGVLSRYSWPGNVRELEHVIERACVLCNASTITTEHLPHELFADMESQGRKLQSRKAYPYAQPMPAIAREDESESEQILRVLKQGGGNKAKAARLLGIDRSTLYRKMKQYNIDISSF